MTTMHHIVWVTMPRTMWLKFKLWALNTMQWNLKLHFHSLNFQWSRVDKERYYVSNYAAIVQWCLPTNGGQMVGYKQLAYTFFVGTYIYVYVCRWTNFNIHRIYSFKLSMPSEQSEKFKSKWINQYANNF